MLLSRSDYGKLLASKGERAVTVKRCETVEEVLRSADVVSLHCNLDDSTRHLMNAERLGMMKPDAVLVNAARGPCIDEAALVAHLKANPNFRAGAGAAGKSAARCCSAESGAERVAGQWGRAGRVGQSGSLGSGAERAEWGSGAVGSGAEPVAGIDSREQDGGERGVPGWQAGPLGGSWIGARVQCQALATLLRSMGRPLCRRHTHTLAALLPALTTGLDVFEDEPAMKPGLEECENAVIVPHIASATLWTRAGMVGWRASSLCIIFGDRHGQEAATRTCAWKRPRNPGPRACDVCLPVCHKASQHCGCAGHARGLQRGGHAFGPPGVEQARCAAVCRWPF